jgi:hypothetical protein
MIPSVTLTHFGPNHAVDDEEMPQHKKIGAIERIEAATKDTGDGVERFAGDQTTLL